VFAGQSALRDELRVSYLISLNTSVAEHQRETITYELHKTTQLN